jgi:hypothetical protein
MRRFRAASRRGGPDPEIGRDAEGETAAERAAQTVDTVAEWVEPHSEPHRPRQVGHRTQSARKEEERQHHKVDDQLKALHVL